MGGYIKLHRKIFDWKYYKDINTRCLWLHLILSASHKKIYDKFGNEVLPGQISTSIRRLAASTRLTVRSVRTSMDKLKNDTQIDTLLKGNITIITINNWDKYQLSDTPIDTPPTHHRQRNTAPSLIDKNVKNIYTGGVNDKFKKEGIEILEFLNNECQRHFKPTALNLKYIIARLKEGHTKKDLSKIISYKKTIDQFFIDNPKFYNPQTLFRPSNFEKYQEEVLTYEARTS